MPLDPPPRRESPVRAVTNLELPHKMRKVIAAMAADRVTLELFDAFEAARVQALLLKGPSIAHWLYENPNDRTYGDTDLLVAPEHELEAEAVLAALGFAPDPGVGEPDPEGVAVNHMWMR